MLNLKYGLGRICWLNVPCDKKWERTEDPVTLETVVRVSPAVIETLLWGIGN